MDAEIMHISQGGLCINVALFCRFFKPADSFFRIFLHSRSGKQGLSQHELGIGIALFGATTKGVEGFGLIFRCFARILLNDVQHVYRIFIVSSGGVFQPLSCLFDFARPVFFIKQSLHIKDGKIILGFRLILQRGTIKPFFSLFSVFFRSLACHIGHAKVILGFGIACTRRFFKPFESVDLVFGHA